MSAPVEPGVELVTVRLLGLPLRVHERASQQAQEMRREFQLITQQSREHAGSVPVRLEELSATLSARYEGFTEEQERLVEDALAAGERQLPELTFRVPAHAGEAAAALAAILDEADEFCREGRLLALATPSDAVAYRNWYLQEFRSQCAGGAPRPWDGPLD